MKALFTSFLKDQSGSYAALVGILAVPLLASAGVSADYAIFYQQRSALQNAADSAALASAREIILTGAKEETVTAVARSYVASAFSQNEMISGGKAELDVTPNIDMTKGLVTVNLSYTWSPFMAQLFSDRVTPIKVSATAGITGQSSICSLSLDENEVGGVYLTDDSSVTATDCAVHSNSTNAAAIAVATKGLIESNAICSSGGYLGQKSSFSVTPLTDCPPLADPLAERQFSMGDKCDFDDVVITDEKRMLKPGVYCGGVFVTGESTVEFAPGNYEFAFGDLDVGGDSRIFGNSVNFNFVYDSRLFIRNNTELDLAAPRTGALAGILITSSLENNPQLIFEIQSQNARNFTGLVYLPNNLLKLGDDLNGDGICDPGNDAVREPGTSGIGIDILGIKIGIGTNNAGGNGKGNAYGLLKDKKNRDKNKKQKVIKTSVGENDTKGCESDLGHNSDWTAVIARKLVVTSGVALVLNADYADSQIPVPQNNGAIGGSARLLN